MRISVPMAAVLVLLMPALALATGTVRIQQANHSVQSYTGVIMKVTLTLTSPDHASTLEISGAKCGPMGALLYCSYCSGGGFTLVRGSQDYPIPFKSGAFYFNMTDTDQPSPQSTVLPHTVVFDVWTVKGTHIIGSGKLD